MISSIWNVRVTHERYANITFTAVVGSFNELSQDTNNKMHWGAVPWHNIVPSRYELRSPSADLISTRRHRVQLAPFCILNEVTCHVGSGNQHVDGARSRRYWRTRGLRCSQAT